MNSESYDVIIIGCGPGGSSAATFLSQAGKRVLVLEKEIFPRFHIGESLLPCNMAIFREMGVLPALQAAGFPRKFGARFELSNGSLSTRFAFRQGKYNREPEAIQVERAVFDNVLLKHARATGAEVREGWSVSKFATDADGVSVDACAPDGRRHQFRAAYLIDASGRGNVTGNQEGLRVTHPRHKKLAVFGHFTGVLRVGGEEQADIIIVRLPNKWFWIIPISREKTSVGLVIDKDEFGQEKGAPQEIFERWVESATTVKERMANATLQNEIRTTSDFSYFNRRLVGDRLLRVGDAAGFMDPIFSAGVFLAMWTGKLAAETIRQAIAAGKPGGRRFEVYERRARKGMMYYCRLVENFYTTEFMELFLRPTERYNLFSAVVGVLAGEVEGSWALRWRMELFFLFVKIQARWPISPRINFRPGAAATQSAPPDTTRLPGREKKLAGVPDEFRLKKPSSLYSARLWNLGSMVIRWLPRALTAALARALAAVYWRLAARRRGDVIENFTPVLNHDHRAAIAAARKMFAEFALKVADLWRYESGADMRGEKTAWRGWENFEAARAHGRGVLLVTPHLGNWEIGAAFFVEHGVSMLVLTQPEPQAELTRMRQAARARRGIETLVVGEDAFAFIEIIKRLEAGATVALLLDRPPPATAVTVELFGKPFAASIAPAELARASGCVILPGYIVRNADGYSANILPEISYDRAAINNRTARIRLTQEIMRAFEPAIRQHVEQWYHFVPVWSP